MYFSISGTKIGKAVLGWGLGAAFLFLLVLNLSAQTNVILKVGIHEIEPLIFLDSEGKAQGFVIDILEYIFQKENWEIEYVYGTWPQCVDKLIRGEIDLLVPIIYSEERNQVFNFNKVSIFSTWGRVFSRREVAIESILDLEGKTVSAIKKDIFNSKLKELTQQFELDCHFLETERLDDAFISVVDKQSDAVVSERINGHAYAQKYGLNATSIVFNPDMAFFAVPKGRGMLILEIIDQHLGEMKANPDSFYHEAYESWLGQTTAVVFPRWLIWFMAGGGGLLVVFIIFIFVLRAQVNAKTRLIRSQNLKLEEENTYRRQAEAHLKQSLKEKEVMLREIHHRVKNNMQVISSLLRLQARSFSDADLINVFNISQNRIRSMALIHESLYKSGDLAGIQFFDYLQKLTLHLHQVYKSENQVIDIKINVKDITLDINKAIPLGLIANELVSNSLKHAFPGFANGEVFIDMYQNDDGKYVLIIKDNGIGLPEQFDIQNIETLGMQLVLALVKQISGTLELGRGPGTSFKIIF